MQEALGADFQAIPRPELPGDLLAEVKMRRGAKEAIAP